MRVCRHYCKQVTPKYYSNGCDESVLDRDHVVENTEGSIHRWYGANSKRIARVFRYRPHTTVHHELAAHDVSALRTGTSVF